MGREAIRRNISDSRGASIFTEEIDDLLLLRREFGHLRLVVRSEGVDSFKQGLEKVY